MAEAMLSELQQSGDPSGSFEVRMWQDTKSDDQLYILDLKLERAQFLTGVSPCIMGQLKEYHLLCARLSVIHTYGV